MRGLVLALLLVTSGCLGVITDQNTSFEATPATIDEGTASANGYQSAGTNTQKVTENFTVADQKKTVTVSNHITTYEKTLPLATGTAKAGVVSLIATPQVNVLGQTFNPVKDLSNEELVKLVQDNYKGMSIQGPATETKPATVLGKDTEVSKFDGTATISGQSVDVFVHVTKVKHEGDFVIAVAVYPQQLSSVSDEEAAVVAMLEAVSHEKSG